MCFVVICTVHCVERKRVKCNTNLPLATSAYALQNVATAPYCNCGNTTCTSNGELSHSCACCCAVPRNSANSPTDGDTASCGDGTKSATANASHRGPFSRHARRCRRANRGCSRRQRCF